MHRKYDVPDRIHLIAHAGASRSGILRFGFGGVDEYVRFIRKQLPKPLRLTHGRRFFEVVEDEPRGGRQDDAARVRDLQTALDDPRTLAIVAASGGAYFSRILPHLDGSALARRKTPLWAFGFSEMTTLVNLVASYRGGRGVYWLCPNYLAWKIRPAESARAALGEFWRTLPVLLDDRRPDAPEYLDFSPIRGELVSGKVTTGRVRLIGGCLTVLAAVLAGPPMRRVRPNGHWLLIEDIREMPYRTDRHLAALKIAGWFDRIGGVLVGDFRLRGEDMVPSVVEMLKKLYLPRGRNVPIVTTRTVGHVWPMVPIELNRPLTLTVDRRRVTIAPPVR